MGSNNLSTTTRPFRSELVVTEQITELKLRAYHIGYDQGEFRLKPLVDVIRRVIPEFALGYIGDSGIPINEVVEKLREAATTIYTTDNYKKRGEIGELILHFLLRDFHNTIPLVSKIFFKDAMNVTVHGFDGVQITTGALKKLWLGESKIYDTGTEAIDSLSSDIAEHINADYIRKEFTLIKRKLPSSFPDIEHWRSLLSSDQRLDTIFDNIVIPMVATYSSNIFRSHQDNTNEYFQDFEQEVRTLSKRFWSKCKESKTEIILMLMPVESKEKLLDEMDDRLKAMQAI